MAVSLGVTIAIPLGFALYQVLLQEIHGIYVSPNVWLQFWLRDPTMLISFGLAYGSIGALWHGGFGIIQHCTVRFLLFADEKIAWNYAGFLDAASDHLLLRKVGGGYIFIHQLLRDYFAEQLSQDGQ
jgi:hypothetical protein